MTVIAERIVANGRGVQAERDLAEPASDFYLIESLAAQSRPGCRVHASDGVRIVRRTERRGDRHRSRNRRTDDPPADHGLTGCGGADSLPARSAMTGPCTLFTPALHADQLEAHVA